MKGLPGNLWDRAKEAVCAARHDLAVSPNAAGSRAYYAAFYAVSARFALKGKTFTRHSGVEAAVHRDLVKQGVWPADMGRGYSRLVEVRSKADYGQEESVSNDEAEEAVRIAADILRKVAEGNPEVFGGLGET